MRRLQFSGIVLLLPGLVLWNCTSRDACAQNSAQSPMQGPPAFDLNGIWKRATGNPGQPFQSVLMVMIRDKIIGINIDRTAFLPPGVEYLRGSSTSPNSFKTLVMGVTDTAGITNSKVVQSPATLRVIDAEHFQIAGNVTFVRTAKTAGGNVACDIGNPVHISGNEALGRGIIHDSFGDSGTAICWFRVGADQGNAQAELNYGWVWLNGLGGFAKDPAQAFAWLQKSAMHGNDMAATRLSEAFASGGLAPRSEQRSKYWAARAELTDPRWFHRLWCEFGREPDSRSLALWVGE